MAKIADYEQASTFDEGDVLLKDGTAGTMTIGAADMASYVESGINYAGKEITFSTPATRANIATGESIATVFGKIARWFTDLKSHCFQNLIDNKTTETAGQGPLDAHQAYVLDQRIDKVDHGYLGTEITSGGNLNDCLDFGTYYCYASTTVSGISNKPSGLSKPFIMYVDNVNGPFQRQMIFSSDASVKPEIYIRMVLYSSGGTLNGFGSWFKATLA